MMMMTRSRRRWIAFAKVASISAMFAQLAYGPKW
jgi:hypothetical protein